MSDQQRARRPVQSSQDAEVEKIASATAGTAPSKGNARTVREIVDSIDEAWRDFYGAAKSFPSEHMDEHLGEGWTRKQMLAHITVWHDVANQRLSRFIATGEPSSVKQETDSVNAQAARQAVGRTAGEVMKDMELSFQRLRRQVARLTDDQLNARDAWAADMIAINTYEHYAQHADDVFAPPEAGRGGRR